LQGLEAIFSKKKKKCFSSCAKRESLSFYTFNCFSLRVFVVNHNLSSTTTEAYWSSNIEDQEEELLRGSEATAVEGKWVACLGTRGVRYKGFVSVIACTT
jgi:hypothetical protein